jgi:hypothetical protein
MNQVAPSVSIKSFSPLRSDIQTFYNSAQTTYAFSRPTPVDEQAFEDIKTC